VDGNVGLGGLLSPTLQNLGARLAEIQCEVRARVVENVLDLLTSVLLSEGREVPVSSAIARVRVKFWIETHLGGDLSGDCIAAACRMAARAASEPTTTMTAA
jgi:hypothetical protein